MNKIKSALIVLMFLLSVVSVAADNTTVQNSTDNTAVANVSVSNATGILEVNDTVKSEAGITPDSTLLWGLSRAIERIDLLLTFDNAAKAKKGIAYAAQRLAEVQVMIAEKKFDAAQTAAQAHQGELADVESEVSQMSNDNATQELQQEVELESKLNDQENAIAALNRSINIQVKGAMTPEEQSALEQLISSFHNSTADVSIKIEANKEKTKIKIKATENKTSDEVNNLETEISNEVEGNATVEQKPQTEKQQPENRSSGEQEHRVSVNITSRQSQSSRHSEDNGGDSGQGND